HVEADIARDLVQPRPHRGATLEAVEALPCPHQRLLHRVVGLERRTEHSVAVRGELSPVLFEPELVDGGGLRHGRAVLPGGKSATVPSPPGTPKLIGEIHRIQRTARSSWALFMCERPGMFCRLASSYS